MADVQNLPDISNLKNSKIFVHVEEALVDCLVVSFEHDSRIYQGVLLDGSKRNLPCGISTPTGFPNHSNSTQQQLQGDGTDEDKLHSVSQRHTYFQMKSPTHPGAASKECLPPGAAYHMRRAMRGRHTRLKNSKLTVRLRPRQVLCSKCKSICNENSENVDLSRKRKSSREANAAAPLEKRVCTRLMTLRSSRAPFSENPQDNKSTSNNNGVNVNGRKKPAASSVADQPRIRPSLISKNNMQESDMNSISGDISKVGEYWTKQFPSEESKMNVDSSSQSSSLDSSPTETVVDVESVTPHLGSNLDSEMDNNKNGYDDNSKEDVKSIISEQEDIVDVDSVSNLCQDDSELRESYSSLPYSEADDCQERMVLRKKRNVGSMEDLWDENVFLEDNMRRTTPVIKISFGSQGEGTVLKIPAKVRSYLASESETEETGSSQEVKAVDASAKAAKRALKKAKKEARRKLGGGNASPMCSLDGNSPAYDSTLYHRRRKRKVKHKKRHKEARSKRSDVDALDVKSCDSVIFEAPAATEEDLIKLDGSALSTATSWDDSSTDYNTIKDRCLKQKLSINLKRVNANAYARCGEDSNSSSGSRSPGSNSGFSGADELPDFPDQSQSDPLIFRVSSQDVTSCQTVDGRTMEVGDIVWGKIHGFPWWPGKVLSITISQKEDGSAVDPQAHVAWYGSSTSSLMPCDQLSPFLETFKTRYNKKKRGPYKEAIRQATCEAQKIDHQQNIEVDVVS